MGTNLQAQAFLHRLSENTTAITFDKCEKKYLIIQKKAKKLLGHGACESGRAQTSTGRAQRPQKYA